MVLSKKVRCLKKQTVIPAIFKRGSRRWIPAFAGMTLFLLNVLGCSKADFNQPPVIRYGKDRCAECQMIINEEAFASALLKADGGMAKFDDIGCLVRFRNRLDSNTVKKLWVHDYESNVWVEGDQAAIVHFEDLMTPMGYSLAAFGSLSSAREWAGKKNGEIINALLQFRRPVDNA